MLWRAALIVSLAMLLAACGKSTVGAHGAEQAVVDVVFKQTGFRLTNVRCPSGAEARVGVTFDCQFTGPEGPYVAHMRITQVQGERVLFAVNTLPTNPKFGPRVLSTVRSHGKILIRPQAAEQTVLSVTFEQTGVRLTDVRCPSDIEARLGGTFDCHFTGPEGPYTAHFRITEVQSDRVVVSLLSRPSA